MGGALVLCALSSAALVMIITFGRTTQLGKEHAEQFVKAVAPEMSYGLLIAREDGKVAETMLKTLAQRPDVMFAQLFDADGSPVMSVGRSEDRLANADLTRLRARSLSGVASSAGAHWHVVAPVVMQSTLGADEAARTQLLGHLYVIWSRDQYEEIYTSIALAIGAVSLITIVGSLAWTIRRSRRLTAPIVDLARSMDTASLSHDVRAIGNGTAEIDRMAAAFNMLMERLADHRDHLEQTVQARTSELQSTNEELRLAMHDAQQAERFKSAFLAAVSHEMKTPLHSIDAYIRDALSELEFLGDAIDSAEVRSHLMTALAQKEQLLGLIKQILELARAKAGRHTLRLAEINVKDWLAGLRQTYSPIAKSKKNLLAITHEGAPHLVTDPQKLSAIAENLLTNACTYTCAGAVSLRLTCTTEETTLIVSDNGCGIDANLVDVVWEEFRQGDMGETRSTGGTGLGLAVTKAYVELLKGSVKLEGVKNEGTTITVVLPVLEKIPTAVDTIEKEPSDARV